MNNNDNMYPKNYVHLSPSDDNLCRVIVTIPFGSGHEPAEWSGLAHLLEHCLFLGSDAIPLPSGLVQCRSTIEPPEALHALAPGELQGMMMAQGIRINASTRLEQSCYMIECPQEQLKVAFSRLCQLIYAPQFLPEQVIAEVAILDGEYQAYCEHPEQQLLNLIQAQAHPEHVFYRFLAGNRNTLAHNDPELLRQLSLCFQQGYLQQPASLYIEHPNSTEFNPTAAVLYQQLEWSRQHARSESFRQQRITQPQKNSLPTGSEAETYSPCPPLFCGQQTFLAITSQPVLQWAWSVDNQTLNHLLLQWGTVKGLEAALKLPDDFRLSVAMQWQQQAVLIIHYKIPDRVETLASIQDLCLEKRLQFQRSLQEGCHNLLSQLEDGSIETARQKPQRGQPALLRATETAIQHGYRLQSAGILTNKLPLTEESLRQQPECIQALTTEVLSLEKALKQPPAVALISHPELSKLSIRYLQTRYFPTAYLSADSVPADEFTAPADQTLCAPEAPDMPFRALFQQLAVTVPAAGQQDIRLTHSSERNHAALIWKPLSDLDLIEISRQPVNSELICRKLYPTIYQQLRTQQRIGYIVQAVPFPLQTETKAEGTKQDGVAFLVQSASCGGEPLLQTLSLAIDTAKTFVITANQSPLADTPGVEEQPVR